MKRQVFTLLLILTITAGCKSKHQTQEATVVPATAAKQEPPPVVLPPSPHITSEVPLFDGTSMKGWEVVEIAASGGADLENGNIKLHMGGDLTGIRWTNTSVLPRENYEIELEAMKLAGSDFFCGLTFPAGTNFCSLILGGWGGSLVGISSIDNMDASENETSRSMYFEKNRWYQIRLQVTPTHIRTWIDGSKVIDVGTEGRKISMRFGDIEKCIPLGLSTWQTSAQYRNIKLKPVSSN